MPSSNIAPAQPAAPKSRTAAPASADTATVGAGSRLGDQGDVPMSAGGEGAMSSCWKRSVPAAQSEAFPALSNARAAKTLTVSGSTRARMRNVPDGPERIGRTGRRHRTAAGIVGEEIDARTGLGIAEDLDLRLVRGRCGHGTGQDGRRGRLRVHDRRTDPRLAGAEVASCAAGPAR